MKAIPMESRLAGKRVSGYFWAGPGDSWPQKENYFQLGDQRLVSAVLASSSGAFVMRCKGAVCDVSLLRPRGRVLSTTVLALPRGKKRTR